MFAIIKQHDERDCGAACLSMVLQHHGKKLPLATIREAIKVDQDGANVYGLLSGGHKFSLDGEAFEGPADEVWKVVAEKSVSLPAIIRILNRGGYEHFVVVSCIRNNKMLIKDPDAGHVRVTMDEFSDCFLGQIITFKPNDGFVKENLRKGQLARFSEMLFRQKKLLVAIGMLSLIVTCIGLAGSFIFQYIIDNGLGDISEISDVNAWAVHLAVVLLGLGVLYAFRFIAQLLRGKALTIMTKNIDLPLMLGFYNHVADLPLNFFETWRTGEVISRFNDATKIRDALSNATLTLMIDSVMVFVCGAILYNISRIMFFITLGVFATYILVTVLFIRPLDKMNRNVMEKSAMFNSHMKESVDGMETVKALQAESVIKDKTSHIFCDYLDGSIKGALLSLKKDTIVEAVTAIGTLIILWIGVLNILHGEMTLGTLITFYSLLSYFLSPVQNLVELQNNIQTAVVAADRLNDILNLKTEQTGTNSPDGRVEKIEFKNLDFRYGNRDLILHHLNYSAKKGEQIALVGESGCGKSTAIKLLMGMYMPENGNVYINDIPMNELSLSWFRTNTAYVPQHTTLFSGTIRENIIFGLEKKSIPSDEKIQLVLEACCCEFAMEMPFGIDTMIEENGANLSGGQRQRLAIARAILRDPSLLILDEATSALDTVTEFRIQQTLHQLLPDATVVMVAHRLSTIKKCNHIFVMDHGSIVESGTHAELINSGGKYSSLWAIQNL
jgi:ATP-binding cassette subfamily B protein